MEIIDTIIDNLATIDDTSHTSLRTCARASRYFLHCCRRHIYSSIVLKADHSYTKKNRHRRSPHKFTILLENAPEIATYVRKLDFHAAASYGQSKNSYSRSKGQELSDILKKFTLLRRLTIQSDDPQIRADWNELADCLQDALFNMFHLPNLNYLSLSGLYAFPIWNLARCSHLITQSIVLNEYSGGSGISMATAKIVSMQDLEGQHVFNFQKLTKFVTSCTTVEDVETIRQILKETVQLRYIDLYVAHPCKFNHFSETLFRTQNLLRKMVIHHNIIGRGVDPLSDLPNELNVVQEQSNILEELEIRAFLPADSEWGSSAQWRELDNLFNSPGWPCLKIISIRIISYYWNLHNNKRVPQFPLLSVNKNIAFELFINGTKIRTASPKD
ncbi:hypothetical protein BDN70DRAFT_993876 [Pholiota conissans]|uniref:Uncharacterized protein n=1 Tax=Pholiota conissans TaxID=109636 RepID=A0A9P6D0P3_9AGAR|nr:hypothetical protein BDN70DRAFT_993876 [Pholiota conissans]